MNNIADEGLPEMDFIDLTVYFSEDMFFFSTESLWFFLEKEWHPTKLLDNFSPGKRLIHFFFDKSKYCQLEESNVLEVF